MDGREKQMSEQDETYMVCSMCHAVDSYTTNGDVGWCSECRAVEQDWMELTDEQIEEL